MTSWTLIHINEPMLSFGFSQQTEHPKDGLFLFGPPASNQNPARMDVGVIGTTEGIRRYEGWVIPSPADRDSSAASGVWYARRVGGRRRAKPRLNTVGRDQRAMVLERCQRLLRHLRPVGKRTRQCGLASRPLSVFRGR